MIVDAYNEPATMAFYEQNDFKAVFSTEQQEKDYRNLDSDVPLNTRLMYYDLMNTAKEYMQEHVFIPATYFIYRNIDRIQG